MTKYSFVIPVKEINGHIRSFMPKISEIGRDDFEIIIYPDIATEENWNKTRQIATGNCGPAEKRNLARRDALGEILIFVDDDAYPEKSFLDFLDKDFKDENIVAVGGPAITPSENSFWQKVSGATFLSRFSHSHPERYVPIGEKRFVNDWPTVNLSVRKKDFISVGGFDCDYWPGEDTKFCLDLLRNTDGKILYDPNLVVWHSRREGLLKHLKQLGGYGLHRGFFARKYPKTSFKMIYFIPSVFFLFVALGWITIFIHPLLANLYFLAWFVYGLALVKSFSDMIKYESVLVSLTALLYVFLTHLAYGARFIQGFIFTKELKSKLR